MARRKYGRYAPKRKSKSKQNERIKRVVESVVKKQSETKVGIYNHNYVNTSIGENTWVQSSWFSVAQGTASNQRVGNRIQLTGIRVSWYVNMGIAVTDHWRMLLLDAVGAGSTLGDLSTGLLDIVNPNSYKVLKERDIYTQVVLGEKNDGNGNHILQQDFHQKVHHFYHKLNRIIKFDDNNSTTPDSMLPRLVFIHHPSGSTDTSTIYYRVRYYYKDLG